MEADPPAHLTISCLGWAKGGLFTLSVDHASTGQSPLVWWGRHRIDEQSVVAETAGLLRVLHRALRRPSPGRDAAALAEHGRLLFDLVLPAAIKRAVRDSQPGRLTLLADETVPWPLLHDGKSFLGCRWALGELTASSTAQPRWSNPPHNTTRQRLLIVADPAADLPAARFEGEALVSDLAGGSEALACDLRTGPLNRADFLRVFRGSRFVHFAGHADAQEGSESAGWRFADGRLNASDLAELGEGPAPALVFANACQSAGAAHRGLARAFQGVGVRHFIGATVDVPDLPGADFARSFFAGLCAGMPIGEALRSARQTAFEAGDSIWAAYRLYGDPATIYFRRQSATVWSAGARRAVVLTVRRPIEDGPLTTLEATVVERRRALGEIVELYGGRLLPGSGAVERAVFGLPVSYEQDALRAARAAMAIGPHLGAGGVAVIEAGTLISADADDVAGHAALNAEAATWRLPPGVYALPGAARRLAGLAQLGACDDASAVSLLAVGEEDAAPTIPLVGRRAEMARLEQCSTEVLSMRTPWAVTIMGPAGAGKSRLAQAVVEQQRGRFTVLMATSAPYGETSPYAAISGVLRALIGASDQADEVELRQRLDATVSALDAQTAGPVSPLAVPSIDALLNSEATVPRLQARSAALLAVLGLAGPSAVEEEPPEAGVVPAAFRALIEASAQRSPLLLIIEDLHWLPHAGLAVVDELVAGLRDVPVMMVVTARLDLLTRAPTWFHAPRQLRMDLGPLSAGESEALLNQLAPAGLQSDAARRILDRAEGNPLFLRELELAHREQPEATRPPANIEEVILARLDRQSPFERELLRAGAALGRTFWREAVQRLLGQKAGVAEALERLQASRFIVRRNAVDLPGYEEWRFTHALLQEVVYHRTSRRARVAFHARAALWLSDEVGPERTDIWARTAAHFAAARDPARSAHAWLQAAARAIDGHAPAEARLAYASALDQDDAAGGALDPGTRAEIEVELSEFLREAGELKAAAEHLEAASADTASAAPARLAERLRRLARIDELRGELSMARTRLLKAQALLGLQHDADGRAVEVAVRRDLGWLCYRNGDYDGAMAQLDGLLADVPTGAQILVGSVHNVLGIVLYGRGDYRTAGHHYARALSQFEAAGHERRAASTCNNLGILAEKQGDFRAAVSWHQRGVRLRVARGDREGLARCYNNLGTLHWSMGEYERARDYLMESIRIKKRAGDAALAVGYANLGEVYIALNALDEAQSYLERAIALCEEGNGPGYLLPDAWRMLAEVRLGQQAPDAAAAAAQTAMEIAQDHGDRPRAGAAARARGEALAAAGDSEGADAQFVAAIEILETLDQPLELGKAYAARARHLAATLPAEARHLREQARVLFTTLGAAGELARL